MSARYACCKHCPRLDGAPCAPKGGHALPCHAIRIVGRIPVPTCVSVPFEEAQPPTEKDDQDVKEARDD